MTESIDARPPQLAAGQVYAGWQVERELARGGMGVLYLARHPRLPRTDVIKILSPYLSSSQRFRDRFLAEVTRMSLLSHPHVMAIHDSGQADDGTLYLVMPYVAGGDLRGLLRREGVLEPRRAARLVAQVAAALDAAHRVGVVHRDVKPENVLLASVEPEDNDHALLTDFGISREELSASTLTTTGELLLTPAYAAPEQALGQVVDARADQYALACILVELLTGRPPYANATPVALLMAHLHEPVPQIAAQLGRPRELDGVLAKALAKQPGDRYASCRDFANAVSAVLDPGDQRVTDEPPPPPAQAPPPAAHHPTSHLPQPQPQPQARRRRWPWVAAGSALVVAGGAVGVVLAVSGGDTNDRASRAAQYTALLARLPDVAKASCADTTDALPADERGHVQTVARCTQTIGTTKLSMTYRTLLGSRGDITSFRQRVLGLGGDNHHRGNCLTLTPDPGQTPGKKGFGQDLTEGTVNGPIWCGNTVQDPTLWYLQNMPQAGSLPILTEVQTSAPGGLETALARQENLFQVAPLR